MSTSNSTSPPAATSQPSTASTAAPPVQPPLPPAHLFDILPPLHALLARLEPSLNTYTAPSSNTLEPSFTSTSTAASAGAGADPGSNSNNGGNNSSNNKNNNNNNTNSTSATSDGNPPTTTTTTAGGGGTASHPSQELAYKDVVTASQFLKARMRKALAELARLGDMDRTVEEQEREIAALERRIEGQRAVLGRLAESALAIGGGGGGGVNGGGG
ncbi:hypothetical protein MBLNU459_g4240t1 [Dothideomycetes sp. NU459]